MERERHKEAMTELHSNNQELQEELQAAQGQLEDLLAAVARDSRRCASKHSQPPSHAPSKVLCFSCTLSYQLSIKCVVGHNKTCAMVMFRGNHLCIFFVGIFHPQCFDTGKNCVAQVA